MREHAAAKLNLSLDVLRKTPDGYHDLVMVMQSIDFGDEVDVELDRGGAFTIDPGQWYLPADGRNLAVKAARVFLEGTGLGASIRILKRTPVCAGMGGGSSDAAAVLRCLNRLTGAGKSAAELCAMAERVGSDVPFCVIGGTALAEGRGGSASIPGTGRGGICTRRRRLSRRRTGRTRRCPCRSWPRRWPRGR